MAKHKLLFEDDFSFDLIGICSSNADYRLSWAINRALSLALVKDADLNVRLRTDEDHLFSFYSFFDEDEHIEYYLIKNLSDNFLKLIPEQNQIDYFLVIKNNFTFEVSDLIQKLKEVDIILAAFPFDPNSLKSKGNLVF